ncbi:hypothetical protein Syun_018631 [Stephania yunnanensis]|uniref:Expansin-like B1 n=1 Tax=Stephania yunnanensis TaxID=152371 RepID=A0AAP0NWJ2_9MAGN
MGLAFNLFCSNALCLLVLLPAALCTSDPYTSSRAAFYGTPDGLGTPSGACGYGDFGRTLNDGVVAAVSNRLYKNGLGCGACYQVKCNIPSLCSQEGAKVVVTDHGEGDRTDFILSPRAFAKLALPNKGSELKKYGVVDIKYQRISCQYPGHNIKIKIHESSRYPDYLAILIIYKGGKSEITAVELLQGKQWKAMRNAYGAVWDLPNPPKGPLTIRFQVSENGVQKWIPVWNTIPSHWKPGASYDTNIQLPS